MNHTITTITRIVPTTPKPSIYISPLKIHLSRRVRRFALPDVTLPESEPDLKAVTSGVTRPSRLHRGIVPACRSLRAHGLPGGPAPICAPPPLRAAVGLARKRLMRRRCRALALPGLVRRTEG